MWALVTKQRGREASIAPFCCLLGAHLGPMRIYWTVSRRLILGNWASESRHSRKPAQPGPAVDWGGLSPGLSFPKDACSTARGSLILASTEARGCPLAGAEPRPKGIPARLVG